MENLWDCPRVMCTLAIEIDPWEKARVTVRLQRGILPLIRCGRRDCEWLSDISGDDV